MKKSEGNLADAAKNDDNSVVNVRSSKKALKPVFKFPSDLELYN